MTHDGGKAVLRKKHKGLNVYGKVIIHNNCFIGTQSILLPGMTIGPNSVVRTGSIVHKDVPHESVVAGVRAKVIKALEEYEIKALRNGVFLDNGKNINRKSIITKHVENRTPPE